MGTFPWLLSERHLFGVAAAAYGLFKMRHIFFSSIVLNYSLEELMD